MLAKAKNRGGRPPSEDPKCCDLFLKVDKINRAWLDEQDNVSEYVRSLITTDRINKTGQ